MIFKNQQETETEDKLRNLARRYDTTPSNRADLLKAIENAYCRALEDNYRTKHELKCAQAAFNDSVSKLAETETDLGYYFNCILEMEEY